MWCEGFCWIVILVLICVGVFRSILVLFEEVPIFLASALSCGGVFGSC